MESWQRSLKRTRRGEERAAARRDLAEAEARGERTKAEHRASWEDARERWAGQAEGLGRGGSTLVGAMEAWLTTPRTARLGEALEFPLTADGKAPKSDSYVHGCQFETRPGDPPLFSFGEDGRAVVRLRGMRIGPAERTRFVDAHAEAPRDGRIDAAALREKVRAKLAEMEAGVGSGLPDPTGRAVPMLEGAAEAYLSVLTMVDEAAGEGS